VETTKGSKRNRRRRPTSKLSEEADDDEMPDPEGDSSGTDNILEETSEVERNFS
jgi:hypothetical protein